MDDSIWYVGTDGGLYVHLLLGGRCGGCQATHFIFINRDGQTLCVGCDGTKKNGASRTMAAAAPMPE